MAMALQDDLDSALAKAVRIAGSQVAFAALIGKRQSTVQEWLAKGRPLPAEYVRQIEAALGIPRHELRPDIYPPEEHAPAARATAQQSAAHPSASVQSAPLAGQDADGSVPALDYAPSRDGADPLKGMAA
jgi:DNA-binding transcriptional regulator YdaS (Cro superfamily)